MDETTKIITDNLNLRLEKVEIQNEKQSSDINSIKLDIQKLNNKLDNVDGKVDTLDNKINDISVDLKDFKMAWQKGLKEIDDEKTAILENKLKVAEKELEELKNNNFWAKLKNGLTEKSVNILVLVILSLLFFGGIMLYKNGIGLL